MRLCIVYKEITPPNRATRDNMSTEPIINLEQCLADRWADYKKRAANFYSAFGWRFILIASAIDHVLQGFVFGGGSGGLIGAPIPFILRDFRLTAARIQVLRTIAVCPWALKPFLGIVSDTLYIGGYRKMPYMYATTLLAVLACLVIGLVFPQSPVVLTTLLFLVFLQIALSDLLIEAKYAEAGTRDATLPRDVALFTLFGGGVCQLASVVFVGFLIPALTGSLQYFYLMAIPFFLAYLYPVWRNWMSDEEYRIEEDEGSSCDYLRREKGRQLRRLTNLLGRYLWYDSTLNGKAEMPVFGLHRQKIAANRRIFALALVIGLLSLFNGLLGLFEIDPLVLMLSAIGTALAMIGLFFVCLDERVARILTYIILQNMFSIDFSAAVFFFYTDDASQFPEGPHFSVYFYVTVMGIIGVVFMIVGIFTYALLMHEWRYRKVFFVTNSLYIVMSITNILFFARVNRWMGWPDGVFVLGSEVLQVVTAQWSQMPLSTMMLQLCPPELESTMYALLAGSSNLGLGLAAYQGAYVMETLGVRPTGAANESVQFDKLWVVALVDTLVHVVPLFFIPFLIPDAGQTDKLTQQTVDEASSVTGTTDKKEQ